MALLFLDGFEEYTTEVELNRANYNNNVRYVSNFATDTSNIVFRTAQSSARSAILRTGAQLQMNLQMPASNEYYIGFASRHEAFGTISYLYLSDLIGTALSTGISLGITSTGFIRLLVSSNSSVLATSTIPVVLTVWNYLEIRYLRAADGGNIQVKLNGDVIINYNGDTTFGTSSIQYIYLRSPTNSASHYIDDLYICDSSGSTNNTFLGPVNVYTLTPTANESTQLTPSTGSNFQCVDELPQNLTDYVSSTALYQTDFYEMSNLPITPTSVPCALIRSVSTKLSANTGSIQMATKLGATVDDGDRIFKPANSTYTSQEEVFELDPNGAAWTESSINAAVVGLKVVP